MTGSLRALDHRDGRPTRSHGAMGGSPVWRLGYVVALIGLAAVTALLHGATGRTSETAQALVGGARRHRRGVPARRLADRPGPRHAVTGTELRAVPWAPVAGGTALGLAALLLDGWVVPNGPGSALLWFALAGFATAAAFVLDEPSAAAVDAVPVPRRTRTARRLLVGLLPVAGWLGGTAALVRSGAGPVLVGAGRHRWRAARRDLGAADRSAPGRSRHTGRAGRRRRRRHRRAGPAVGAVPKVGTAARVGRPVDPQLGRSGLVLAVAGVVV